MPIDSVQPRNIFCKIFPSFLVKRRQTMLAVPTRLSRHAMPCVQESGNDCGEGWRISFCVFPKVQGKHAIIAMPSALFHDQVIPEGLVFPQRTWCSWPSWTGSGSSRAASSTLSLSGATSGSTCQPLVDFCCTARATRVAGHNFFGRYSRC